MVLGEACELVLGSAILLALIDVAIAIVRYSPSGEATVSMQAALILPSSLSCGEAPVVEKKEGEPALPKADSLLRVKSEMGLHHFFFTNI